MNIRNHQLLRDRLVMLTSTHDTPTLLMTSHQGSIPPPSVSQLCFALSFLGPDARLSDRVSHRPHSKHGELTQCCLNVGPPSVLLAQH